MVTLLMLCLPPLVLTIAMFLTCNMMLGFPSAIFWGILGGYAYLQSSVTWDWQYILFFASMGMVIFSMFAAFALRKRDLAGPDVDREEFIDEARRRIVEPRTENVHLERKRNWGDIDGLDMYALSDKQAGLPAKNQTAKRAEDRLHKRAEKRRAKAAWGEFK